LAQPPRPANIGELVEPPRVGPSLPPDLLEPGRVLADLRIRQVEGALRGWSNVELPLDAARREDRVNSDVAAVLGHQPLYGDVHCIGCDGSDLSVEPASVGEPANPAELADDAAVPSSGVQLWIPDDVGQQTSSRQAGESGSSVPALLRVLDHRQQRVGV